MKILSMTIDHCRSFKDEAVITFERGVNILVGPNSGGKSNILDILSGVYRGLFYPFNIYSPEPTEHHSFRKLMDDQTHGKNRPTIRCCYEITDADVENLKRIQENRSKLEEEYAKHPIGGLKSLSYLDEYQPSDLKVGATFELPIINADYSTIHSCQTVKTIQGYHYLLDYFRKLGAQFEPNWLSVPLLHISPYRNIEASEFQIALTRDAYQNAMSEFHRSHARSRVSPAMLATLKFAAKWRLYEAVGGAGWKNNWDNDEEVKLLHQLLARIGFTWGLDCIDVFNNEYRLFLNQNGKSFDIAHACSGDCELICLVFMLVADKVRGGLVLLDEPELHLHPSRQLDLYALLSEFARLTDNQVIMATHSPVFIRPETIKNVRRIFKLDGWSNVRNPNTIANAQDTFHLITAFNNEKVFFADLVVLVEGPKDRIFFEKLIRARMDEMRNNQVLEVIEVQGKNNFEKYEAFLTSLAVPHFVIADTDFLRERSNGSLDHLFQVDKAKSEEKLKNVSKSKDLKNLLDAIEKLVIGDGDREELRKLGEYIRDRGQTLRTDLSDAEQLAKKTFIEAAAKNNCFILEGGAIEDYLPDGIKRDLGKLLEATENPSFVSTLQEAIDSAKWDELCRILGAIIPIPPTGSPDGGPSQDTHSTAPSV